jgi:hypothetical protein
MPVELVTKQELMNVTSLESIIVVENILIPTEVELQIHQTLPVSRCNNRCHDVLECVPVVNKVQGYVITPITVIKYVPVTRQKVVHVTKDEFVSRPVFQNIYDYNGRKTNTVFCGYC